MLRITRCSHSDARPRLVVEGRLTRREVTELRGECRRQQLQGARLVLDLSGVLYADESGARALGELQRDGAELVGVSAFVRELLDEASS